MSISHDVIQIHTGKCYKKIPEKMIFQKKLNDRTNKGKYHLKEDGSIFFLIFVVSCHEVYMISPQKESLLFTLGPPQKCFESA